MNKEKRRLGQSVVEWALVLPILMLFIFGLIDLSLAFSQKHSIDQFGSELIRKASIGKNANELQLAVKAGAKTVMNVNNLTYAETVESGSPISTFVVYSDSNQMKIKFKPSLLQRTKGKDLEVIIEYQYHPLTPFIENITDIPLNVSDHSLIEVDASN